MTFAHLRPTVATLSRIIDRSGQRPREAIRARLRVLLSAIAAEPEQPASTATMLESLQAALDGAPPDHFWLALSVLYARLPDSAAVQRAVRTARLDGPLAATADALRPPGRGFRLWRNHWPTVEVVTDRVVVDVHHTSETTFATGIQRVARQSVVRWHRDHDPLLIGWAPDYTALRRLHNSEIQRACYGTGASVPREARRSDVLVPWRCTYLLPELLAEPPRAQRLKAMVEFSASPSAVIGFDCVPLTSAETTAYGMSGGFALNLAAVAHMDRIATISHAAATEYRGWRTMLGGAGLSGPQVVPIPLPVEGSEPTAAALGEARRLLMAGDLPMVLVVGSHEPRKNHLAVLHAAELLWRDGLRFSLNFVGGNSWNSERFERRLAELQAGHRPVQAISALSDDLLWAAYRLARFTVFPSFSEGFGLPVAESLASGTPAITSDFGSMREIAAAGGAMLVNPRDDHELAAAMRELLTDDAHHASLAAQARAVGQRTWDDYAERVWNFLVHAQAPEEPLVADSPNAAVTTGSPA